MKEYNWREERKKYQSSVSQNTTPEQPQVQQAPPVPPAPAASGASKTLLILGSIAIIAIAVVLVVFLTTGRKSDVKPEPIAVAAAGKLPPVAPTQPTESDLVKKEIPVTGNDTASMFVKQAEKHKHSVGLVFVTLKLKDGKILTSHVGTAWAFAPNKFATNSHVAYGIRKTAHDLQTILAKTRAKLLVNANPKLKPKTPQEEALLMKAAMNWVKENTAEIDAIISINAAAGESYSISYIQTHRNYMRIGSKKDHDVAVLTIDGNHKSYFKIASQEKLYNLKAGTPVAYLGYPMERLSDSNYNEDDPIATMQTGILTSVTDFQMKDSGPRNNQMLRHNMPSAGGASGSPVFDKDGEVIALHYAGNYIYNVQTTTGVIGRVGSAAQINFAVRADMLRGVGKMITLKKFIE